nr:MAG TPA: hypothetical protein [Caudoviricetes sp.]
MLRVNLILIISRLSRDWYITFPILYWKKTVTLIGKILGVLFN